MSSSSARNSISFSLSGDRIASDMIQSQSARRRVGMRHAKYALAEICLLGEAFIIVGAKKFLKECMN